MFDELTAGAVFGEAPVILNSKQYVTTVAATASDLWYIPKDKFIFKLLQWPLVRNKLAQEGQNYLEKVRTTYKRYHHHTCPTLKEMMQHADAFDLKNE